MTATNTVGDAHYNSLQAELRHNFSNGILLQASYTWSRNNTNVNSAEPGLLDVGQTDFGTSGSNNPLDFAQQYGPYSGERTQRLIVSYSYDLPWKSTEGISGKVLSGWTVSGVTTLQNGQPFTITDAGGGSIYGGASRALLSPAFTGKCGSNGVCQPSKSVGTSGSTTARVLSDLPGSATYNPLNPVGWINPSAFTSVRLASQLTLHTVSVEFLPRSHSAPAVATKTCGAAFAANYWIAGTGWGNSPIGIITGPGQWNWDMSLQKNTKIHRVGDAAIPGGVLQRLESSRSLTIRLQRRLTGTPGSTFGQINSTSVAPRVIQFGVKFLF